MRLRLFAQYETIFSTETTRTLRDYNPPRLLDKLENGTVIGGRYSLVSLIGTGGMGAVYLAVDAKLGRKVAIKVVSADADGLVLRRFEREARIMAGIKGGGVVQVHDYGVDKPIGVAFHVMDAVLLDHAKADAIRAKVLGRLTTPCQNEDDGELVSLTLENILAGSVALDERTTALLALEIIEDIHVIHGNNPEVIHRDLKPSNLIFNVNGNLLLSDFGIAKYNHAEAERMSTLTMAGSAPGTPSYASPEQRAGAELTAATDYYSFGLVIYRMLTGGLPGTATSELPSDVKSRVSRKWNALLSELLEREPEKRLDDYAVVKGRLQAIIRSLDAVRKLRRALATAARVMVVAFLSIALVLAGIGIYHALTKHGNGQVDPKTSAAATHGKIGVVEIDPFAGEPTDWSPENENAYTDLVEVDGVQRPVIMEDEATVMSVADVIFDKEVLRTMVGDSNKTIDLLRTCAIEQTNNAVRPQAGGGALVVGKGQVFDFLSCPNESLPKEIILDGGTLLFALPFSHLEQAIAKAVEEKNRRVWCWRNRKWLPSENGPPKALDLYEVEEWIKPNRVEDAVCRTPIKVRPGRSTIKVSPPSKKRINLRGPIVADGEGAMLLFQSQTADGILIDSEMLSPDIAVDKKSIGLLWDFRTGNAERRLGD